jgi:hypothetical protein
LRTREQVLAHNPPLFDVIVFIPSAGTFERHATLDNLPVGLFPTESSDLTLLLPNRSAAELDALAMEHTGRTLSPQTTPGTKLQFRRLWWYLRHMPVTHPPGTPSTQIPKNFTNLPAPRPRQPRGRPLHKPRSGRSQPDSKHGTQVFELLYKPAAIEGRDLAFLDLPPIAHEVVRAIISIGKKEFSRSELVATLTSHPGGLGQNSPWDAFTRYRALLIRQGFISAKRAGEK